MKKRVFYAAALAAILASCSSDNLSLPQVAQQAEAPGVEGAVNFSAYTPRSTTRAGYAGVLNDAQLQKSKEQGGGFGVFGYYTDQQDYDLQISKPNFMYNQGVFYSGGSWTYSPIKYWPNEYGSDAESQDIDKVTFFAYAPYVDVNATTGKVTGSAESGITAVSRNTNTGDPIVWYKGSFKPSEAVDLCWGTVASDAQDWKIIQDNGIQRMDVGFPWLNVQRPKEVDAANQKLKFEFKHALAQLNIQIDADADLTEHNEVAEIGDLDAENKPNTKVYVRSISISGLASKGSLNLNNIVANEPLWQSYYGSGSIYSETATIFDGRRDGKEGVSGATAVNETLTGLNPAIISDDGNTTTGVTKELKNLFDAAALTDAIYTIPTGEPITVSIVYDVETADQNLANVISDGVTRGSSIENKITKEVVFGEDEFLKAGKKYTLILHLGLNSVKFDAVVSQWENNTANGETWLPSNVAKGITLDKSRAVMNASGANPFTATVQPDDVVDKTIKWSTNADPSIATIDASTGAITIGAGLEEPTEIIVTAANAGTGKSVDAVVLLTKSVTNAGNTFLGTWIGPDKNLYCSQAQVKSYNDNVSTRYIYVADKIGMQTTGWGLNLKDYCSTKLAYDIATYADVPDWNYSYPTVNDIITIMKANGSTDTSYSLNVPALITDAVANPGSAGSWDDFFVSEWTSWYTTTPTPRTQESLAVLTSKAFDSGDFYDNFRKYGGYMKPGERIILNNNIKNSADEPATDPQTFYVVYCVLSSIGYADIFWNDPNNAGRSGECHPIVKF